MIRILIADPDFATRKALALLLRRKLGTDCIVEAENVETLLRVLADKPPELLLLDGRFYGAPAPEICSLLRMAYPRLKIILLSVNVDDAPAAKQAGVVFIHKGAPPDQLIATLTSLLSERK
jgi:DNA-binding NarL/FixJ family response regulator